MLSGTWLFATSWTVVRQAPLSMGFPRQEYWSGLPFPSPGEFLNPGIEPRSPALAGGFFTTVLVHCDVKVKKYQDIRKRVVCVSEQWRKNTLKENYKFYVRKMPWRRKWQPTPVLLPGESHGERSLVGYNPWGRKESDTTKWLHFTSLHGLYIAKWMASTQRTVYLHPWNLYRLCICLVAKEYPWPQIYLICSWEADSFSDTVWAKVCAKSLSSFSLRSSLWMVFFQF